MIPRLVIAVRSYSSNGAHAQNSAGTMRSSSILASLLRLRQQYQRAGGATMGSAARTTRGHATAPVSPVRGSGSEEDSSRLSGPALVSRDALRLLSTETRPSDNLSDVPKSSAQYGAEVGKLLAVAATFGAASSLGRVREALDWVTAHPQHLTTTRQVMSIAMPLLNLQDGAECGAAFVYATLLPLLLTSLASEGGAEPSHAAATSHGSSHSTDEAHRASVVAVVSVFQLVAKLLAMAREDEASTASSSPSELHLSQLVSLFNAASMALQRLCPGAPALEMADCFHAEDAYLALDQAIAKSADDMSSSAELETTLTRAFSTQLLPVLQAFFLPGAVPPEAGRTATVLVTPWATTASLRSTADLVRVLQALLSLSSRPSTPTSAVLPLLAAALSLLPGALSAASARELANAAMIVTRIRQAQPDLVTPACTLTPMVEAMRPKLFQLVGTHQAQLGALECSVLLSNFAKWNEAGPTRTAGATTMTVVVSEDLTEMLFTRMTAQMRYAHAPQLVPLLDALVRLARHYGDREGGATALFRRLPSAEETIHEAHRRLLTLVKEEGKISAMDAAHILTSLAELRLADPLAMDFFLAAEPLLTQLATPREGPRGEDGPTTALSATERAPAHSRTVALHALDAFLSNPAAPTLPSDASSSAAEAQARAVGLRDALLHDAMAHASAASSAKELVMLFRSLETALGRPSTAAEPDEDEHDEGLTEVGATVGASAGADADHARWDPFVKTVTRLAPTCNAFEVAALTTAVASIAKNPAHVSGHHGRAAMDALLQQAAQPSLTWTLAEAKRFMDGVRMAGATAWLPPLFVDTVTILLATDTKATKAGASASSLSWAVHVGRTLLSVLRRTTDSTESRPSALALAALLNCCAAYAGWCEALIDAALEAHPPTSSDELLQQLCLMSFVVAQMKRTSTRLMVDSLSSPQSSLGDDKVEATAETEADNHNRTNDDEDAEDGASMSAMGSSSPLEEAATDVARSVDDAMLSIGEAVQLTLLRSADLVSLADGGEDDDLTDMRADEDENGEVHSRASGSLALRPKDLIMLLQAYVVADVRHPTLFEDLLPSLVVISSAMDALELSLLLTSLAHLGVWNARVVMQLAQRAESQLAAPLQPEPQAGQADGKRSSVLRQANGILRALQQTRALASTTFLRPSKRQTTVRQDWHTAEPTRSPTGAFQSPEAAFVALAQASVDSLDALVCTKAAMDDTLATTTLPDLVLVVHVLTSTFTAPPQPTTDAYIVLAVKKLVQGPHDSDDGAQPWLRSACDLVGSVHALRRYDHRAATVRAVRRALVQAQSAIGAVPFASALRALPTAALTQLLAADAAAGLFYGEALLAPLVLLLSAKTAGEPTNSARVVVADWLQARWTPTLATTPGLALPRDAIRAVERCVQYLPVEHVHSLSVLLGPLASHVSRPTASLPALSTLGRERETRHAIFVLLRATNTVALASSTSPPRTPSTETLEAHRQLETWLEALFPSSSSSSSSALTQAAMLSGLSPQQLATLWLSVALTAAPAQETSQTARTRAATLVPLLQERLYAKESQLRLTPAVDLLLGAAQYFSAPSNMRDSGGGAAPAPLSDPLRMAVLSVAQLGATALVRTLHVPEATGLPKLYESYRLLLAGDESFLRWFSALKAEHADDGASETVRDTQRTVSQVLRWCAACLHGAEQGGVRQVKLSPAAMTRVKEAVQRAIGTTA